MSLVEDEGTQERYELIATCFEEADQPAETTDPGCCALAL